MLTGHRAFQAPDVRQVLKETLERQPDEIAGPEAAPAARLLHKMLQKNPRRRPASMAEVVAGVEALEARLQSGAPERTGLAGILRRIFEGG